MTPSLRGTSASPVQSTVAGPVPLGILAAFALLGVGAWALCVLVVFARILFPASALAAVAAVWGLLGGALIVLAIISVPLFVLEVALGFWLLAKCVRTPGSV